MSPLQSFDLVATALFAAAILHSFLASQVHRLARRWPAHAGPIHLLGEVEVVFGFWALVLVAALALHGGGERALAYAQSRDFGEPLFVFVVMVVAGSRPILDAVRRAIDAASASPAVRTWLALAAVPILGSLITEPAAMTLSALLLRRQVFRAEVPAHIKYAVLGVLFVNISIGGTLTSFAAPPVLMVAQAWGWDSAFMLATFGWKAAIAVVVNATLAVAIARRHVAAVGEGVSARVPVPMVLTLVHFSLLAAVVLLAHHPVAFVGVFLLFLGVAKAYEAHQDRLVLRDALLVAVFLAGLVVLGGLQQWWLQPIISTLPPAALFGAATALTAITDNAALTYLGSLVEGLTDEAKYSLVAGAVAGGGLTVIANAPNPAGAALLRQGFADGAVGVIGLLGGAAVPTAVAVAAFALL